MTLTPDPVDLARLVTEQVATGDVVGLGEILADLSVEERVRLAARLEPDALHQLLMALEAEDAADILHGLPDVQAVSVLTELPAEEAAEIIDELSSSERADIIGDMEPDVADAVLSQLPAEEAAEIRRMVEYADDEAGGIMDSEFVAFKLHETVGDVIEKMRSDADRLRDFSVLYAYVTDEAGGLAGVLRLRDLLLADWRTPVERIMIGDPYSVEGSDPLDHLREVFVSHSYLGIPVVDEAKHLIGVVRRSEVEEAISERSVDDYRKSQGIVREELRSMPLMTRTRNRLGWLSTNIVLNVIAASVIAFHQDTLEQVIALAVFLPIISDMSGCSGNQAVAVSMRELSLGIIDGRDMLRVWRSEVLVGVINGIVLGVLLGAAGFLWKGNIWLGLVVATALTLNTIIAVTLGGMLPVFMRRMKLDPALASGPILTTVTDVCGFFLVLTLAAAMLDRLT